MRKAMNLSPCFASPLNKGGQGGFIIGESQEAMGNGSTLPQQWHKASKTRVGTNGNSPISVIGNWRNK